MFLFYFINKMKNVRAFKIILSTSIILVALIPTIASQTIDKPWIDNCFENADSERCEDNVVKILSSYYVCEMAIDCSGTAKRIGFINGLIFVGNGTRIFVVRGEALQPSKQSTIPRWSELFDNKENTYFNNKGSTFVTIKETKKEIEIITTGLQSANQFVIDTAEDILLIVTDVGSMYAIKTNTIDYTADKVEATLVEGPDIDVTAISFKGGINNIILGTKTSQGGKLVMLKKLDSNPCAKTDIGKETILNIIEDTKEKILETLNDITPSKNRFTMNDETPKKLQMENTFLKRSLDTATAQLEYYKSKLFNKRPGAMLAQGIENVREIRIQNYPASEQKMQVMRPEYIEENIMEMKGRPDEHKSSSTGLQQSGSVSYYVENYGCISVNDYHAMRMALESTIEQLHFDLSRCQYNDFSGSQDVNAVDYLYDIPSSNDPC